MKKLFILAFALSTFSVYANKTTEKASITIQNFKGESTSRVHQNYHDRDSGDFFNVVYLISHNKDSKQEPTMEVIITTKTGQLVIGNVTSSLIGDFDLAGVETKSLNSRLKEELFFSDPIFDQFINDFKDNNFELKNYSASECNDLASAINAAQAYYMHLRRTSNDDGAVNYFRGILMGMVVEYNGNC